MMLHLRIGRTGTYFFFELLGHSIATALFLISHRLSPAPFEGIASLWALPFDDDDHWTTSNGAWVSHTCIFSFGRSTVGAGWRVVSTSLADNVQHERSRRLGVGSIPPFHPYSSALAPVMEQFPVVPAFTLQMRARCCRVHRVIQLPNRSATLPPTMTS